MQYTLKSIKPFNIYFLCAEESYPFAEDTISDRASYRKKIVLKVMYTILFVPNVNGGCW